MQEKTTDNAAVDSEAPVSEVEENSVAVADEAAPSAEAGKAKAQPGKQPGKQSGKHSGKPKHPSNDVEVAPQQRAKASKVSMFLCALAFGILVGYLVFGGEGDDLVEALDNMRWEWLCLGVVMVVMYWVLEAACMQVFANKMFPGFSYLKTWIVTVIGQYANCITPLSSGGQPFQAYYYNRFGMPLSKSMPMLLCRFISYQLTTTAFCAVVLPLRFEYFTQQYPEFMTLVVIGFVGGVVLLLALLALAFFRKATWRVVRFGLRVLRWFHIVRDYRALYKTALHSLNDAYREIVYLTREPKMLLKGVGITFVQLLEYFSISYVIMCGLGFSEGDYLSVISCQAFVYMISSFVPLPGAMGAAEGSYAIFFSTFYPNASYVALSTFVWRMLTFYFPIVAGVVVTMLVNHFGFGKPVDAPEGQAPPPKK